MAYRRCVAERAKLLYHHQRLTPSFSYITHQDDHNSPSSGASNSAPSRCFGTMDGPRNLFQRYPPRSAGWGAWGSGFGGRNMSTTPEAEVVGNLDVSLDGSVETVAAQVATEVSEVAVAAADSFLPIANLQYFIEYIHNTTGFNWWASIVVATFIIRILITPSMISVVKATANFTLMKPKLDEIEQELKARGDSKEAKSEGRAKMKELFKEYNVTPLTPLKGFIIQGPILVCFFLAIKNMAENVPSFQHGGAYWFVDLTTPDTMYIFPILTALTMWMTVEVSLKASLEGSPASKTIKNVIRAFAALSVPLTASFAKAIFCYWISANVYSLIYTVAIKNPKVKELLGIPIIPDAPFSIPSFSDMYKNFAAAKAYERQKAYVREVEEEACKKYGTAKIYEQKIQEIEQQSLASALPTEASKGMNQKIPAAEISIQRMRSLFGEAKGRKEGSEKK